MVNFSSISDILQAILDGETWECPFLLMVKNEYSVKSMHHTLPPVWEFLMTETLEIWNSDELKLSKMQISKFIKFQILDASNFQDSKFQNGLR